MRVRRGTFKCRIALNALVLETHDFVNARRCECTIGVIKDVLRARLGILTREPKMKARRGLYLNACRFQSYPILLTCHQSHC
jgi:hypothetical protein